MRGAYFLALPEQNMPLSQELVARFRQEGYLVLPRAIAEADLIALQQACQHYLEQQRADMDRAGAEQLGLSQRDKRYFLPCRHEDQTALRQFLFGDLMLDLARSLLGDQVYFFHELFVVKWSHTGSAFGWHQDSGYVMGHPHQPYVTLWCALDDMTADNGALSVLPSANLTAEAIVPHQKDKTSGDFIGYSGEEPGQLVCVPKGSIVALASTTFHRSGPNVTDKARRAYLAAYSPEPITDRQGRLWNFAVPCVQDGKKVVPS
jgi:ectoine hydroxylase-related dioxygenase (phytanoyl-CoA dioxygenase family)